MAATAEYLTDALDLQPNALWLEVLKVSHLHDLPDYLPLMDPANWRGTLEAFMSGNADEQQVWQAASQLFLDGVLYLLGFHRPDEEWLRREYGYTDEMLAAHQAAATETQSLLGRLADRTRDRPEPALRIAHCIRDLAYGNESRIDDLKAMVESDDPGYHQIFVDCYWLPTEEERVREAKEDGESRHQGTRELE